MNYRSLFFSSSLKVRSLFGMALLTLVTTSASIEAIDFISCDQNWKAQFYKKTAAFASPELDVKKLSYSLLTAPDTAGQCIALFEEEAAKGNSEAAEKLYNFKTVTTLGTNLVDKDAAAKILADSISKYQAWAYWRQGRISTTVEQPLNRFIHIAANLGHTDASLWIKKHSDKEPSISIQKLLEELKESEKSTKKKGQKKREAKKKISNALELILSFIETCDKFGHAEPLMVLYKQWPWPSKHTELQERALKTAVDLGYSDALRPYFSVLKSKGDKRVLNKFILQCAQFGKDEFFFLAGALYNEGFEGQPIDKKKALELYLKASQNPSIDLPESLYNAAALFLIGFEGQPADKKKALELFLKSAQQGFAPAQHLAADLLREGFEEQPADKKKAFELYLQATESHVPAMINAGLMLEEGFEGQPADKKRALALYLRATERGFAEAMVNAANLLTRGFEGQPADKRKAYNLFLKAGEKGVAHAMFNAGVLIAGGFEGQPADKKRAFELYLKAEKLGFASATINAGLLLMDGFEGKPADKQSALKYLLDAAQKMIEPPVYVLTSIGTLYLEFGKPESAIFWLERAAAHNSEEAIKYLELAQKALQVGNKEDSQDVHEMDLDREIAKNIESVHARAQELSLTIKEHVPSSTLLEKNLEETVSEEAPAAESRDVEPDDDLHEESPINTHSPINLETNDQATASPATNPKFMRQQLRAVGTILHQRVTSAQAVIPLEEKAMHIAKDILERHSENIDHHALTTLFSQPFFNRQVEVARTKSGIAIIAHNREKSKTVTAGTHRKHTKRFKGAHPSFVKDLANILHLFDVK